MKRGLFYNILLDIGIEGMIEFIICGYLNVKTAETISNGEILGILLTIFCLFTDIVFLPIMNLRLVCCKNVKKLSSERY